MKRCLAVFALAWLFVLFTTPAFSQDSPFISGHNLNVFAEFSGARSGQGVGYLWGGSAGAYLQGRLLGLVLRGTVASSNASVHIFDAVFGPRFALNLPFFRGYIEAGGGIGRSGYVDSLGNLGSSWGPAWQADAGLSHELLPHLNWHVLELAYGQIYVGPIVKPVILSTGVALHF